MLCCPPRGCSAPPLRGDAQPPRRGRTRGALPFLPPTRDAFFPPGDGPHCPPGGAAPGLLSPAVPRGMLCSPPRDGGADSLSGGFISHPVTPWRGCLSQGCAELPHFPWVESQLGGAILTPVWVGGGTCCAPVLPPDRALVALPSPLAPHRGQSPGDALPHPHWVRRQEGEGWAHPPRLPGVRGREGAVIPSPRNGERGP